jgi:hypothetical protein
MPFQLDVGGDQLEALLLTPNASGERWERTQRLAAALIRRQVNQHGCQIAQNGTCDHPDHRRDRFYAWAMLDALEVPRDLPPPTREDHELHLSQEVKGERESEREARRASRSGGAR